eukprot:1142602-Pelagomonas_calceolata.AAC.1
MVEEVLKLLWPIFAGHSPGATVQPECLRRGGHADQAGPQDGRVPLGATHEQGVSHAMAKAEKGTKVHLTQSMQRHTSTNVRHKQR